MERQRAAPQGGTATAAQPLHAAVAALRFVTPGWHGALDFSAATALLLAPFPLGLASDTSGVLSIAAGVLLIVYSLLTDYTLGVAKVLSVRTHLTLDAAAALALLAAPFLLGFDAVARAYFVVMGLGVLGAVAATNPDLEPKGELA